MVNNSSSITKKAIREKLQFGRKQYRNLDLLSLEKVNTIKTLHKRGSKSVDLMFCFG